MHPLVYEYSILLVHFIKHKQVISEEQPISSLHLLTWNWNWIDELERIKSQFWGWVLSTNLGSHTYIMIIELFFLIEMRSVAFFRAGLNSKVSELRTLLTLKCWISNFPPPESPKKIPKKSLNYSTLILLAPKNSDFFEHAQVSSSLETLLLYCTISICFVSLF